MRANYDTSLQMFVEETREPNLARLAFMRWLVQEGRLEHFPMGKPSGEFVNLFDQGDAGDKDLPIAV